jgi:hypothetical protein
MISIVSIVLVIYVSIKVWLGIIPIRIVKIVVIVVVVVSPIRVLKIIWVVISILVLQIISVVVVIPGVIIPIGITIEITVVGVVAKKYFLFYILSSKLVVRVCESVFLIGKGSVIII